MFQFKYRVPVRADRLNGKCAFPAIRTVVTVFAEKHPSKSVENGAFTCRVCAGNGGYFAELYGQVPNTLKVFKGQFF